MISLQDIVSAKRAQPKRMHGQSLPDAPRDFLAAIGQGESPRFIAEFKRRSPSAGAIRTGADPAEIARSYEAHGARALSVLTDEQFFDGAFSHLLAAREATHLPVLRKDFLLDPEEVTGGDAVLLIAAILQPRQLVEMLAAARERRIAGLVEVHDEWDCERALEAGADLFGINNRDLRSMKVDLATFARLRPRIPTTMTVVAESGVRAKDDVEQLVAAGAAAILVGEVLMAAPDPGLALRALK